LSTEPSSPVKEMTNIHSMFLFEHQFGEFLCASIGEEKNGIALSVLSAFARRNVDPWQEAARRARVIGSGALYLGWPQTGAT
jgi:hypothetical protein